MKKTNDRRNEKGFTLVELIVVLVILAILAAILIPALLGYIDRAKKQKDLLRAKACLTLVQAGFSECYAINGGKVVPGNAKENTIVGANNVKTAPQLDVGNVNITETEFSMKILNELDIKNGKKKDDKTDPYCIMVGVGSNMKGKYDYASTTTTHEKYTVYYMLYMEKSTSDPLFYYDGKWSTTNPFKAGVIDKDNKCSSGPMEGKHLQFYVLSNKTGYNPAGNMNFWNWYKALGDN